MKGLDTNVLVRYLVRDDIRQAEKASAFIRKAIAEGESCFINHIVLCELVWVLESAYRFPKKEIADVLEKLLMTRQFEFEARDIVRQAVSDYRHGKGDVSDHLIGRLNHARGCNETITFDRALKPASHFVVLD